MVFNNKRQVASDKPTPKRQQRGNRGLVENQREHLWTKSIRSGTGERTAAVMKSFQDIVLGTEKTPVNGLVLKVKTMDKSMYGLVYDVVVIYAEGTLDVQGSGKIPLTMVLPVILEDNTDIATVEKTVLDEELYFDSKRGYFVKGGNNRDNTAIFFPTDTLNKNLKSRIKIALDKAATDKMVLLDGVIMPAFINLEDEHIVGEFITRAIDPILDYWRKVSLNKMVSVKHMCEDNDIKTNFFSHKEGNTDLLGVNMDDSFTMQVYLRPRSDIEEYEPNSRVISELLLEVRGVVSLIPGTVSVNVNGVMEDVDKLIPVIVGKDVDVSYILEDALMTVASLAALTNDNHWMDILIDASTDYRDPGMMLKAIGVPEKSFMKKGVSREAKEEVLFNHCTRGGMVALDIAEYSLMSGAFGIIQSAAAGDAESLKEIIKVCVQMCQLDDGSTAFDPKFNINNILRSTILPNGYFSKGIDSKNSLSSIDTDYIASRHPKYLETIVKAETASKDAGLLDIIGIYNDIGLKKARLTGIRRRVTFTAEFIKALTSALAECGFIIVMDPAQTYKKQIRNGFDRETTMRYANIDGERNPMIKYRENNRQRGDGSNRGAGFVNRRM